MRVTFYLRTTSGPRELCVVSSTTDMIPVPRIGELVQAGQYGDEGRVYDVRWNFTGSITDHKISASVYIEVKP